MFQAMQIISFYLNFIAKYKIKTTDREKIKLNNLNINTLFSGIKYLINKQ